MVLVDVVLFVCFIFKYVFEVGVEDVIMDWCDEELGVLCYKNVLLCVFESVLVYCVVEKIEFVKEGVCFIFIIFEDLDLLNGVDSNKIVIF